MSTFKELIAQNDYVESILEDADTYDQMAEEFLPIWESSQLALKQKIDNTGYFLESLSKQIELLKDRKQKLSKAQKSIENTKERIKTHLHYVSEGRPLRGDEFSFHPYVSNVAEEVVVTEVEPEKRTYVVEMNYEQYVNFASMVGNLEFTSFDPDKDSALHADYKMKETAKASDLPANHPAIKRKLTPSVRIS